MRTKPPTLEGHGLRTHTAFLLKTPFQAWNPHHQRPFQKALKKKTNWSWSRERKDNLTETGIVGVVNKNSGIIIISECGLVGLEEKQRARL